MSVATWKPNTTYAQGDIRAPRTQPPVAPVPIVNGSFTSDASSWTLVDAVWSSSGGYDSPGCVRSQGAGSAASVSDDQFFKVAPGQRIQARAYVRQTVGTSSASYRVVIEWLDASDNPLPTWLGLQVVATAGEAYRPISVTAIAPALAAKARVAVYITHGATFSTVLVDAISWDYITPGANLIYKAVQTGSGTSAATEPSWPLVVGTTVIDGGVTWEAMSASLVVWRAKPIMKTGATEPDWPLQIGGAVVDGTVSWHALDPMTKDENCPNTVVVAIAQFKVFAADKDVVRFTATLDPQDWTSEQDAGYLGVGLNQGSANHVSLLNLYRANLVVMNPVIFQQWQIDPDPQLMDMLDRMDGIGSSWHLAACPVADDLFYLSNRGVRTVGVSGATHNLRSGDVGLPVDPIVAELTAELVARNVAGANEQPLGMYLPGMGQYWLSYNRIVPDGVPEIGSPGDLCPTLQPGDRYAEVMVYTMSQVGQVGAWSRYVFPFAIDDWAQEGDDLYVRDGDSVFRVSEEIGAVDLYRPPHGVVSATGSPFQAIIQWPWLDMGRPGQDKQMESFDFVGYGRAELEFGYDQSEPGWFTAPYLVEPDTVPAQAVPMALNAPSYSVRIRYHGWNPSDPDTEGQRHWSFNAMAINLV